MKLALFFSSHDHHLIPKLKWHRWKLKTAEGHIWYLNGSWLFFGFQLDNEK